MIFERSIKQSDLLKFYNGEMSLIRLLNDSFPMTDKEFKIWKNYKVIKIEIPEMEGEQ